MRRAAQVEVGVEVDDADVLAGMSVEQAFAVGKRGFVATAQHQRARAGLLNLAHRRRQGLLALF